MKHRTRHESVDNKRTEPFSVAHYEGLGLRAEVTYEEQSMLYGSQLSKKFVNLDFQFFRTIGYHLIYYIMMAYG